MLVFSELPITAEDAARVCEQRRATRIAYFKRHTPARIADAWYTRGQYGVAVLMIAAYAFLFAYVEFAIHGRRIGQLEDIGIVCWMLATTAFIFGNAAATIDTIRRAMVAYRRREISRRDLRSTDAAAVTLLKGGPGATLARVDKLRSIRTRIFAVLGSSGFGGIAAFAIEHNPEAIWRATTTWAHVHPTLAHMSVVPIEFVVGVLIVAISYLNSEISFCVSAGDREPRSVR